MMNKKASVNMSADSKNSDTKRQYGCPCGKTYLSYPALFTHVKHKHNGKAPGELIKPETGKIRGRPKTRVSLDDQEMVEISESAHREVSTLLTLEKIIYWGQFATSEGVRTCQDAASKFLGEFMDISESGIQILSCFLNELKEMVDKHFGQGHWERERPDEIIQVANALYSEHEEKQGEYPISKPLLKELIFNFFEWLYAYKFTDHRLQRVERVESQTKTEA